MKLLFNGADKLTAKVPATLDLPKAEVLTKAMLMDALDYMKAFQKEVKAKKGRYVCIDTFFMSPFEQLGRAFMDFGVAYDWKYAKRNDLPYGYSVTLKKKNLEKLKIPHDRITNENLDWLVIWWCALRMWYFEKGNGAIPQTKDWFRWPKPLELYECGLIEFGYLDADNDKVRLSEKTVSLFHLHMPGTLK